MIVKSLSVIFFTDDTQRKTAENYIKHLEKNYIFNNPIVTEISKLKIFYEAENYHQDYYRKKFLNYLRYKKACGREKKLNIIWNK